jgi:acyl-CoA thioesterase-1
VNNQKRTGGLATLALLAALIVSAGPAAAQPATDNMMRDGRATTASLRIVALGDSNTAGFWVGRANAFPALMEASLRAEGIDVEVLNRGISGDTTGGMLARLDAAVTPGTRVVILQGGYNDRSRAVPAQDTAANIDAILARLGARRVRVVLCDLSGAQWAAIARRHGALLVPSSTCYDADSRGFDGLHMNAAGHRIVAARLKPVVRRLISRR